MKKVIVIAFCVILLFSLFPLMSASMGNCIPSSEGCTTVDCGWGSISCTGAKDVEGDGSDNIMCFDAIVTCGLFGSSLEGTCIYGDCFAGPYQGDTTGWIKGSTCVDSFLKMETPLFEDEEEFVMDDSTFEVTNNLDLQNEEKPLIDGFTL